MNFLSSLNVLKNLGLDAALLIAGIAGGIAFLPKNSQASFTQKFVVVLSGAFTANYLTPLVTAQLNLSDKVQFGIAFLLGYGGLKSVELLWNYMSSKFKTDAAK